MEWMCGCVPWQVFCHVTHPLSFSLCQHHVPADEGNLSDHTDVLVFYFILFLDGDKYWK